MITYDVQVRVRYAETDRMGYVYYGNYATYLEVARVETLRYIGISYKEIEDSGIMLPVGEYKTKFIKPAKYDDLLTIRTYIKNKPGVRIVFEYEVFNQDNVLLNTAETTLVFVNSQTGRPCQAPEQLLKMMEAHFK
ncbi:MAG: acyl-CoA thioesterase [Cytophagaceae bacterium]|nr:acyl-CoA thioesterase [Cytophagaceae bacterium]